jgi:hypothetical protein
MLTVVVGCGGDPSPSADTTGTNASADGTVTGAATGSDGTSGSTTSDAPTTIATASDGSATGSGTTGDVGMELEGKPCDLMALDPSADPAAVIDAGDGPEQIPTVIGDALLRNCGCHYTDNVGVDYTDYDDDVVPMATHADFHVLFAGVFPAHFHDQPVYAAVEQRVSFQSPAPMPPIECGVEGEPGTITAVDRALFVQWLAAGAPDGANFP